MSFPDPVTKGVLIAASRDPDAKLTYVVTERSGDSTGAGLALKIPSTPKAACAVESEGRMLVTMRRLPLGPLAASIPRYVESPVVHGRNVLISTAVPGTPMMRTYHQWHHTAHPASVRRDFAAAARWLHDLRWATVRGEGPTTWPTEVLQEVRGRWDGHERVAAAAARIEVAEASLAELVSPRTVVHGDFWFGNLMVEGDRVTGVVDWENGTASGSPLRDLARFVLSYALYLDRHVRPGHRVPGHPGLRRQGFGQGVVYALLGSGWLSHEVRSFLGDGLVDLGLPRSLWYDVALAGLGEIAATANDDTFASQHLNLLAQLPCRPRRA